MKMIHKVYRALIWPRVYFLIKWWDGRVDECTGLENRKVSNGLGGSNPPPTAS